MKDNILTEVIKVSDDLVIPGYIVKNYEKIELEGLDFILLLYFINRCRSHSISRAAGNSRG